MSRSPGRPGDSTRRSLLAARLVTLVLVLSSASGLLPLNDAAAAPRVTAQPAEAIPLAAVAIQGSGFPKESSGRLIWSDSGETLKTFRTNKQGRFATTVRLPDVVAGQYEIVARVGRTTQRIAIQVSDPVRGPVALGIFQPNVPSQDALNRAADLLGREPEIAMWYQHWGFPDTQQLVLEHLQRVADRGAVPMITWEPWDPRDGLTQPRYQLKNLCTRPADDQNQAQRDNNDYIDDWARGLAEYNRPVLLRFAHEMNGTWYPWATGVNENKDGDYVAAWRCIRDRFAVAGATNVEWVWSPNVSFFRSADLGPLFPGSNEVDWLGLDGYNFGGGPSDWQTFAEVFDASLVELENLDAGSGNLPVMIAETASAEAGGSKAAWIRAAMFNNLPLDYPQVRAFIWFNQKKEQDWRFTSSDAARAAFRAAANHPYYAGDLSP